jgi:large subunit ribosomal protein L25
VTPACEHPQENEIVSKTELVAEYREGIGKGHARKIRAVGRLPAVLYGRGRDPMPITTDPRALERILQGSDAGRNTLIELVVQGRDDLPKTVVLVKELQTDPVAGSLLHADFNVVDLEHAVHVAVPVRLVGLPVGVSQGEGILDHTLREVEVECLPRAIPDEIEIDVSKLEIDDSIHVRELTVPEGVKILSDESLSVVSVVAPRAVEEEVKPAEGEEAVAEGEGEAAAEEGEKKEGEEKPSEEGGE